MPSFVSPQPPSCVILCICQHKRQQANESFETMVELLLQKVLSSAFPACALSGGAVALDRCMMLHQKPHGPLRA